MTAAALRKLLPYLGALLACTGLFFVVRADILDRERTQVALVAAKRERDEAVTQAEDYKARVASTNKLAEDLAKSSARIRTITNEVIREVPIRIPTDACPLPPSWRVLHDAAAQGTNPPAATGADDAAVPAQDAARTVIENYGICNDTADRLTHLQRYVKEQCSEH